MSIRDEGDEDFVAIRSNSAYRAALWLVRSEILLFAMAAWLVFSGNNDVRPGPVVVGLVTLNFLIFPGGVVLLRRAGIRLVRRGTSWQPEDPRVIKALYRDVFWLEQR